MKEAAKVLIDGGIAVIPTDTIYGIVCRAADNNAVGRLYGLKNRERKPGTVMASSIDQLVALGIKKRYLTSVQQYWPGSISVVVPSEITLRYLDKGLATLAVRIVDGAELTKLLNSTGPLLTTSANHTGELPASTITQAKNYFGNEVDAYVDGGDLSNQKPSTLIRIVDDAIEILREGAVVINEKGEITS